jgi:large subunit ribosomal protein L15
LSPHPGSVKKRKRVGRGSGSGHGKTSCKGHKGQKARSGGGKGAGFEGGQMPLQRRLPKRGFTNPFQKDYAIVNLIQLAKLEGITEMNPETFVQHGLIKNLAKGIKILAKGEIDRAMKLKVHAISKSAREKVVKAGGEVDVIPFSNQKRDVTSE